MAVKMKVPFSFHGFLLEGVWDSYITRYVTSYCPSGFILFLFVCLVLRFWFGLVWFWYFVCLILFNMYAFFYLLIFFLHLL